MAVLGGLALAAPVVALEVDESAVPPSRAAPDLPPGVTVAGEEVQCGSGGCWRDLRLHGPADRTPAELLADVGLADWTCGAVGLLDRRTVCSQAHLRGEDVVLVVVWDRHLDL